MACSILAVISSDGLTLDGNAVLSFWGESEFLFGDFWVLDSLEDRDIVAGLRRVPCLVRVPSCKFELEP